MLEKWGVLNTCLNPTLSPSRDSLNRSLSHSLCPSDLGTINHFKWTAVTGMWLLCTGVFFLHKVPVSPTVSLPAPSTSLTPSLPPSPHPISEQEVRGGVSNKKQTITHLLKSKPLRQLIATRQCQSFSPRSQRERTQEVKRI